MDSVLQRLADEAAIKDLQIRYCRAIDRRDWELLRTCFHPDATYEHWAFKGDIDAVVQWCDEGIKVYESTTHFTGNQLVKIDGDSAWAEHYLCGSHRIGACDGAPARDWVVNVRYVDRAERRNGEWRIADRLILLDSERSDFVVGELSVQPQDRNSRSDRTDPSYR